MCFCSSTSSSRKGTKHAVVQDYYDADGLQDNGCEVLLAKFSWELSTFDFFFGKGMGWHGSESSSSNVIVHVRYIGGQHTYIILGYLQGFIHIPVGAGFLPSTECFGQAFLSNFQMSTGVVSPVDTSSKSSKRAPHVRRETNCQPFDQSQKWITESGVGKCGWLLFVVTKPLFRICIVDITRIYKRWFLRVCSILDLRWIRACFYPFQKARYPPAGSGIVGGNLSMTTVGFVFLTCWANRDEQMSFSDDTFHYWTMSKWATLVGVEPNQLVWNMHVCLLVAIVILPFANKVAGP